MFDQTNFKQISYLAAKARAKKLARDKVKFFAPILAVENKIGRISIKDLRSRWGSCSSQGNLNFHFKIIFLPEELVDYIIVHELSHLVEMNHSHRFWSLVGTVLPDYRKRMLGIRRLEVDFFQEYRLRPKRVRRTSSHVLIKRKLRALLNLSF